MNGNHCETAEGSVLAALFCTPDRFVSNNRLNHHHTTYLEGVCTNALPAGPIDVTLVTASCEEYNITDIGDASMGAVDTPTTLLMSEVDMDDISEQEELPCSHKTTFNYKMFHKDEAATETSSWLKR